MVKIKYMVGFCAAMLVAFSCRPDGGYFRRYAVLDKESAKGNRVISYALTKAIPVTEWETVLFYRALCTKASVKSGRVFFTRDSATIFSSGTGIIIINGHE